MFTRAMKLLHLCVFPYLMLVQSGERVDMQLDDYCP